MNILITGSTSGIGLQLARDYLAQTHTVYCCGRNAAILKTLKDDFPEHARNLTDAKDYVIAPYVPNQWIFGDPRAYELSLRYSF
tara:strand:+ start:1429 stop:1680 length:252 start_codon:yes stop_codon:yes gene_type:complete